MCFGLVLSMLILYRRTRFGAFTHQISPIFRVSPYFTRRYIEIARFYLENPGSNICYRFYISAFQTLESSSWLWYVGVMVQSKQELRDLLAQAQIVLRPRLGQNFLVDLNLLRLLAERAQLQDDDTVLEIGAGTGSLTELLAENCGAVVAVEIDQRIAGIARQRLAAYDNVELLCQNALQESKLHMGLTLKLTEHLARLGGRLLLVANLPYNLASPLLIECICGELPFAQLYFTVQREVADRILSRSARKSYGLMSIVFQAAGRAKRIRNVPASTFWPQPRVDSTMIAWGRITENSDAASAGRGAIGTTAPIGIKDLLTVREVARVLLHYRRKKISSCIDLKQDSPLTVVDLNRALAVTGIDANLRGEQLSVEQYTALARAVNAR